MTAWILLPVSLSAFSITGIWIVYAMAVMNHHVCPVENWSYNESCSADPAKQGYPKSCCTLEDVPLISKCGTYPPESCLFSLIGNVGAFMVVVICFLRYGQLIEHSHSSWVNTTALITGCTNAAGLVVVGNFQVDYAKSLHYVGAGVAFPAGLLFVCLQCALSYHVAASALDFWMAHLRVFLTAVALISLVLSILFRTLQGAGRVCVCVVVGMRMGWGARAWCNPPSCPLFPSLPLPPTTTASPPTPTPTHFSLTPPPSGGTFFIHESSLLQHLAAICEWAFVIDILVFYGTFTYEFGAVSNETLVAALQHTNSRGGCKSPGGSSSTSTHLNCNPESIAMI
ncbi:hypothetical protein JRQ81_011240 [Phrynocephalus forsythii]|uniref:Transmembrane protein 150A n=1 Tax=Phrynocephalus forsythii TaxID=171643 RepID=A0A9Q0X7T2_9SAUR|nr:hypothetical protein JRQ81_011240 [Phrynocephalus forsythii]